MLGKVAFAPAPVHTQVFHQKAGHHHAQSVVHVARLVDLCHGRIHQRIAGLAVAPCGKPGLRQRPLHPGDGVVLGLERPVHHVRVVGQNLVVEIAPDQLAQPGGGAGIARPMAVVRQGRQPPNGHGAKTQVNAEVAGPFHRGEVARLAVVRKPGQKIGQQRLPTGAAGGQGQGTEIGGFKPQRGQRGHLRPLQRLGQGRQGMGPGRGRVVGQVRGRQRGHPGPAVGREHAVRPPLLGQHLVALEHHMVFEGVQHGAVVRQVAQHTGVARQGLRLVVVVGEHRLHPQLRGQSGHLHLGHAVGHQQVHPRVASRLAQRMQLRIQVQQRGPDELHPPVGTGQWRQDGRVEHEHAPHLPAAFQRVVQGHVVVCPQVAAEPHQAFVVAVGRGGRHEGGGP